MAGTPVAKNRELLFTEETMRNAGVSEALSTKLAGLLNFHSIDMLMRDDFKANGAYRLGVGSTGIDGILIFPTKVEIVQIGASNVKVGTTGITTFDVHWLSAPGVDEGSIFTTPPSFDSTSGNDAYQLTDVIENINIVTGTGITNPVVNKTVFEQGEAIRVDITSGMVGARDSQLTVYYRPIT